MRGEARRLRLLRRQARIGAIARRQLLAGLAEANDLQHRNSILAGRSVALSREYIGSTAQQSRDGRSLAMAMRFGGQTGALARGADHAAQQASQQADDLGQELARASARRDALEELIRTTMRKQAQAHARREIAGSARLARSLQRHNSKPDQSASHKRRQKET